MLRRSLIVDSEPGEVAPRAGARSIALRFNGTTRGLVMHAVRTLVLLALPCSMSNAHAFTTHWDQETQSYQRTIPRLTDRQLVEQACQTEGRMVRSYADDRQRGISLESEEARYAQQTQALKLIAWTYRTSTLWSPQQAADTVYTLCHAQLDQTLGAD